MGTFESGAQVDQLMIEKQLPGEIALNDLLVPHLVRKEMSTSFIVQCQGSTVYDGRQAEALVLYPVAMED